LKWIHSKLLTHGRDNKLYIFDLDPLVMTGDEGQAPWMVYSQDVNSLSFCSAAICGNRIAVPNTLDSEKIDVYELEGTALRRPFCGLFDCSNGGPKTGIVMAIVMSFTILIAGYESGHVIMYDLSNSGVVCFLNQPHSQPVLSLCVFGDTVISTAADALIVRYNLTTKLIEKSFNTKHSGLSSICVRDDGKIIATAGWDGMVRIFDAISLKMLASFDGGRQSGVACVSFGFVNSNFKSADEKLSVLQISIKKRKDKAQGTHWLASGGKDGRIALYDIY
jgi:WD40 repeat protein